MMNTKEKLIEEQVELCDVICCAMRDWDDYMDECRETETPPIYSFEDFIVDGVISAGYRKQEWISVKDKPPEIVSTHKRHKSAVKKSIRVLCACVQKSGKTMVKEGYCEWYNDYPEPEWQIPGTIDEVTHWQYLPQPPKGE